VPSIAVPTRTTPGTSRLGSIEDDAQREERVLDPALYEDEGGEQHRGDDEENERRRCPQPSRPAFVNA
jgi:hypothetical protein